MTRRYPIEALLEATGLTMAQLNARIRMGGDTYRRAQAEGLSELVADRWANRLGLHPAEVWPDWFEDVYRECAHPDCTERFVPHPRAPHRRFCSHRCRRRYNERSARLRNLPSAQRKREQRRRYYEECGDYERARQRRYDRARKVA